MNRNSAKQKLKDLRTKLANLDFEIRALISKAEMEPGLIDAVVADISTFTQEIVNINNKINKLNAQGIDESISLMSLFKEGAKDDKKSPDEVNKLALSLAKDIEIPDYVLNDERLFTQFMSTLRNHIQPKKKMFNENSSDDLVNQVLNYVADVGDVEPEDLVQEFGITKEKAVEILKVINNGGIDETSTTGGEGYLTKNAFKKK